jgi:hypothetical protein
MHSTGAYAPRSWSHVQTPLQMGDSRRRERYFSHGGLRPPLLALVQRPSTERTTIFAMHERTFDQERRASARRGLVKPTLRAENRALYATT